MTDRRTSSETDECYACLATEGLDRFGYCIDEEACAHRQDEASARDAGFRDGAAVAFGLMGMFEAVHDRAPLCCDTCGSPALWDWRRTWPVFCNETCATTWCRKRIG